MKQLLEIETQIISLYNNFIKNFHIDKKTGYVSNSDKKLATLPFIGSKYGSKRRVLFIGMDIGCDEHDGITPIKQRRKDIEGLAYENLNPHIAGTYFLSLFFLRKEKEYTAIWEKVKDLNNTCQMILKHNRKELGLEEIDNCLSYVSLTNYYKFVTIDRENRAGGLDRNYLKKDDEISLLWNEIEILDPEVIFLQSQSFFNIPIRCKKHVKVIVGNHPSSRESGTRIPRNMIETAVQIIREIS